jgi:EAL domain-containing protein (putative c-di-GMP-specific phosphodiesterase class I)
VDDAGAGYSGLHHILRLRPDLIKLDMSLTRDIDTDPARQALAAALVAFAYDTDSRIIAEGVETLQELETLASLGIDRAQGYLLGRPMPREAMLEMFPVPAGLLPA